MHEQLLAEMTWVRRLARALLRDVDAADDVAQDAWLVASEHAPDDRPLRPWLARVVLNLVRMRGRGASRRQLRELATGDDAATVPTSEELVERVEMQRVVAAEVVALAEPSRQTILLRYVEGLSSVEIARRLGIPDATVRRRLKRALDELRERLRARDDAPSGGWLAALAPLAHGPVAVGALTMKKLIAIAVAILLMLLVAGGVWHARANHSRDNGGDGDGDVDRLAQGSTTAFGAVHGPDHDRVVAVPSWAAQAGAPPRRIAGLVVLGTKPVAGAIVRLGVNVDKPGVGTRRNLGTRPLTQVAVTRTSPAGTFDFGLQPAAAFVVSAEAANASPASVSVVLSDPRATPPPDHLVIALGDCRSRMTGMVRDSANGIARARLRVAGLGGTESDANGHYTLCAPMTSMTGVRVDADGYGTIDVLLPSLYGDMHQDFVLVPEATITGSVVDEAGAPVAAAAISVEPILGDDRHDTAIVTGIADVEGHFQLSGIAPGAYHARARADRAASAQPTLVVTTAGTPTRDLRLVVGRRARLRGRVMMAGTPVAGATVGTDRTDRGGYSLVTAISQTDGSFVLDGLELGTFVLVATPYEVRAPLSVVVDRTDPSDVTIEVTSKGTIRGRVTRHQVPVAGARVRWSDGRFGAVSDSDGTYTLEGLPDGEGYLDAGDTKAWASRHKVTVVAGAPQTVDLELDSGGEIRGTVIDEAGGPVPGVYVRFESTAYADQCESMTDAAGAFDCATLSGPSDYQPTVFPSPDRQQAYRAASGGRLDPVHVADGDSVASDVRLAIKLERLTIRGKVVDDTGAVVADAHVRAVGADPGFLPIPARADGDGGFVVENLAGGTYTLRAHTSDGSEGEVAGISTGASDVQIVVVRAGRIEGTLVGFATPPHVFAELPMSELDVPHEAVVAGSTFTFAGLPAGSYGLAAMSAGVQLGGVPAEVRSGVTTHVTLRASARTTVDGRITDLATGVPLAGASCFAFVSVAGSEAALFGEIAPGQLADATGHFTVDAAVGRVRVRCGLGDRGYMEAGGDFDVSAPTHVEVFGVKQVAPPSQVGFRLAEYTLPNTVMSADATTGLVVGDQLASVDGISVANLLPGTAMTLAQNHRPGSSLVLQILRGGTPMTIAIPIH